MRERCVSCGSNVSNEENPTLPFRRELKDNKQGAICDKCIAWAFFEYGIIHHSFYCDEKHDVVSYGTPDLYKNVIQFPMNKNVM